MNVGDRVRVYYAGSDGSENVISGVYQGWIQGTEGQIVLLRITTTTASKRERWVEFPAQRVIRVEQSPEVSR